MKLYSARSAVLILGLLIQYSADAQVAPGKNHPVITDPVHQANIGKILFTDKPANANEFGKSVSLQQYKLTNKSDLFITVFLGNTITDYLDQLKPGLSTDSLIKTGNYQFSFYIDEKLIYQTNLLPGAPRAAEQNTVTVWSKPLIDNDHEGRYWSQSAWNRFMLNGGDGALTEGKHTLKIELRPYLKSGTLITGDVIASGTLKLEVNRKPLIELEKVKLTPVKPYDGFPVSNESFDQNKIKLLKANTEAGIFKHITSIVVIKNGRLLIEEYFNKATRDSLHDVRSVGKTFASTLTGIAIRDKLLKSEDQPLSDFYDLKTYDHYAGRKAKTTLKDLLTMSSDFDGNDDDGSSPGNEDNMYPTPDWVRFTLNLPMDTLKYKGQWHYFTTGAMLIGSTLDKIVPEGLEKYADIKLFKPLNIRRYQWEFTPQKVVNTAGGIRMNALDFAKYGQLYKNNGLWKGKQILSEDWVRKSFTRQIAVTGRTDEYYGYLFWNKTYKIKGKEYETFYCAGNGGNKIFVFKDQPLVVVITATAFGTAYAHPQVDKIMQEYILPAVIK